MTPTKGDPLAQTSFVKRERRKRRYFGALATLGVVILLVELVLNWIQKDPIEWMPVLIGMVIGFAGFAGLDFKKAHAAGDFIVDSALNVLAIMRTGRRATDNAVVVGAVCSTCHKQMVFCSCEDAEPASPKPQG